MIESIKIANSFGSELELELANPDDTGIAVKNITGLGYPTSNIAYTNFTSTNIGVFNQSLLQARNVTLNFIILTEGGVIKNRNKLYEVLVPNDLCTITFTTRDNDSDSTEETKYITGYVETGEPEIFSNQETIQFSLICPDPYFYGENNITESATGEYLVFNSKTQLLNDFNIIVSSAYQITWLCIWYNGGMMVMNCSDKNLTYVPGYVFDSNTYTTFGTSIVINTQTDSYGVYNGNGVEITGLISVNGNYPTILTGENVMQITVYGLRTSVGYADYVYDGLTPVNMSYSSSYDTIECTFNGYRYICGYPIVKDYSDVISFDRTVTDLNGEFAYSTTPCFGTADIGISTSPSISTYGLSSLYADEVGYLFDEYLLDEGFTAAAYYDSENQEYSDPLWYDFVCFSFNSGTNVKTVYNKPRICTSLVCWSDLNKNGPGATTDEYFTDYSNTDPYYSSPNCDKYQQELEKRKILEFYYDDVSSSNSSLHFFRRLEVLNDRPYHSTYGTTTRTANNTYGKCSSYFYYTNRDRYSGMEDVSGKNSISEQYNMSNVYTINFYDTRIFNEIKFIKSCNAPNKSVLANGVVRLEYSIPEKFSEEYRVGSYVLEASFDDYAKIINKKTNIAANHIYETYKGRTMQPFPVDNYNGLLACHYADFCILCPKSKYYSDDKEITKFYPTVFFHISYIDSDTFYSSSKTFIDTIFIVSADSLGGKYISNPAYTGNIVFDDIWEYLYSTTIGLDNDYPPYYEDNALIMEILISPRLADMTGYQIQDITDSSTITYETKDRNIKL